MIKKFRARYDYFGLGRSRKLRLYKNDHFKKAKVKRISRVKFPF